MKNKGLIIATLIVLVGVGGYFAWKNSTGSFNESKKEVKIGAILPLTGNLAFLGETGQNALSFAQKYINRNKLLTNGAKLKFVFKDGMGIPKNSINAVNSLLEVDKVNIIFSIISSVDLSIIPIVKENDFLFISHATHPELSNAYPLVFRHSPTVAQEFNILKEYIGDKTDSIVLLSSSDDYGNAFKDMSIKQEFVKTENIIDFNSDDIDFRNLCIKPLENRPSKIIICGNGKNLFRIVNVLRELGYKKEIITTLGFKIGGAFDISCKNTDFTYIDFEKPVISVDNMKLLNDFKDKYKKEMTMNEMIFFNSTLLIVEAIYNPKIKLYNLYKRIVHLLRHKDIKKV